MINRFDSEVAESLLKSIREHLVGDNFKKYGDTIVIEVKDKNGCDCIDVRVSFAGSGDISSYKIRVGGLVFDFKDSDKRGFCELMAWFKIGSPSMFKTKKEEAEKIAKAESILNNFKF